MQIRVVAVSEERLRVARDDIGIDVRNDGDLIVAADRRQHRSNAWIRERGGDVGRSILGTRTELACRRILDRDQAGGLGQAMHRLLVYGRGHGRRGERWRQHGDAIAGLGLRNSSPGARAHRVITSDRGARGHLPRSAGVGRHHE